MASDSVKIRVRFGTNEVEIEADLTHMREAVDLIPEILAKLPNQGRVEALPTHPTYAPAAATRGEPSPTALPTITVEKGDSLNDIVSKLFSDPWGKNPRRLSEVREALQSYGLNYPKQSVAVALLRLAKSTKIRRFKGDGGEYLYTASTSLIQPSSADLPAVETTVENTLNV